MVGAFRGLGAPALEDCAAKAVRRLLGRGEPVFIQGDRPVRFHALSSGWVKILQAGADGELSMIRFVGSGELFGSFALFTDGCYPADAIAATDCEELSWSEAHLRQLIDCHPLVAVNLLTIAAERLAELQERLRETSTQHAEQRIANALLRLSRRAGRKLDDGRITVTLPLTRKDLASMSATTLYTASRVISAWERRGIVSSSRRQLTIAAPAELSRIGDSATR